MASLIELKKEGNYKRDVEVRKHFNSQLDQLVDNGVEFTYLEEILNVSEALEYFCGYVARKEANFTDCPHCKESLIRKPEEGEDRTTYLALRDKYGLLYPCKELQQLVAVLELVFLEEVQNEEIEVCTLHNIVDKLWEKQIPLVGCTSSEHQTALTRNILHFLLTTRMYFFFKEMNRKNMTTERTKNLRKSSKY